jgi:Domain of unknown function (DUF4845)
MNYSLNKRQRGMTMISIMFVLGGIGFVVLVILKVLPLYMEHGKVTKILTNLKSEEGLESKSEAQLRDLISKRFAMDDVVSVSSEDVAIAKNGKQVTIEVEYDAIAPIVGNLNVMLRYDDVIEVGNE